MPLIYFTKEVSNILTKHLQFYKTDMCKLQDIEELCNELNNI